MLAAWEYASIHSVIFCHFIQVFGRWAYIITKIFPFKFIFFGQWWARMFIKMMFIDKMFLVIRPIFRKTIRTYDCSIYIQTFCTNLTPTHGHDEIGHSRTSNWIFISFYLFDVCYVVKYYGYTQRFDFFKVQCKPKREKKKRLRCILLTESGTSIEASHHALMLYLIRVHIFILCTIIKI